MIGVVVGTCAIVVMISLGIATNRRTDEMLSTWSDLTQIQVFSYSENPDTPAPVSYTHLDVYKRQAK